MLVTQPGVWRLMENQGASLFVGLFADSPPGTPEPRMIALCWDPNLAELLERTCQVSRLLVLQHVKKEIVNGHPALRVREISEVWRARDVASGDAEVIVFKATDGTSFCGDDSIEVAESIRLDKLVVAIRAALVGH